MIPPPRRSGAVAALMALTLTVVVLSVSAIPALDAEAPSGRVDVAERRDEPVRDAAAVYARDCARCHGADGTGTEAAPSLRQPHAANATYYVVATGRMPLASSADPVERRPPRYDAAMIRALSEHVASFDPSIEALPPVDARTADLTNGGVLYRRSCAPCHMAWARGGALLDTRAPSLAHASPLVVATAARSGPGEMPVFAETQLSERELNDVVAYVDELRSPATPGGAGLGFQGPATETVVGLLFGLGALLAVSLVIGGRNEA